MPYLAANVPANTRRTMNAGRAPSCRYPWRMSAVFGQTLGRKYSLEGCWGSSVKYSVNSDFEFLHVKYVYDCVKPSFESRCITRGRVNASERKISSGCFAFNSEIAHSQKAKALVCGLSTRKIFTPCEAQNSKTLFSSDQRPM